MKLPQEGYDDSRARRLYGKDYDDSDGYFYGPSDYQPIIDSFGTVLVQVDDANYQGDTRVLLEKDGRFGFLNFGWGSCSGCDGLQACSSFRDIEELIRGLEADVKWFDTLQAAKDYVADEDRKQSYYYHMEEWRRFVVEVAAYAAPGVALPVGPRNGLARIEGDSIVIRLTADACAVAFANDPQAQEPRPPVIDKQRFLRETFAALTAEREDGSTPLTDVLDAAMVKAWEDGAEGLDHDAVPGANPSVAQSTKGGE
jgi:hypothetical protein